MENRAMAAHGRKAVFPRREKTAVIARSETRVLARGLIRRKIRPAPTEPP